MIRFRYHAVRLPDGPPAQGEIDALSPADARARLRAAGLRVRRIRQLRSAAAVGPLAAHPLLQDYLRRRRARDKADFLDALATMLQAGITLAEALRSAAEAKGRSSAARRLAARCLRAVESGDALSDAARREPAWFDPAEAAQIHAAERAGDLPSALRALADRLERAGRLSSKLAAALAYPAIVFFVGVAVVLFLSTRTLPTLVATLQDAGVRPHPLTLTVMNAGQAAAAALPFFLPAALPLAALALLLTRRRLDDSQSDRPPTPRRFLRTPRVARTAATADFCERFAELLRSGVTAVDSLHALEPTFRKPATRELARAARRVAAAVSTGDSLASAFRREPWFDHEFASMVDAGERVGNLDDVLLRTAARLRRDAQRRLDRLTTLLEPAVILSLAAVIGLVVLAAVLPLTQLQDIL